MARNVRDLGGDWVPDNLADARATGRMQMRFGASILTDPDFVPAHREALTAHGFATDEATHPTTLSHGERGLVAVLLGFKPNGKGGWR